MTDFTRPPSLSNLPPLPPSDSSSEENHGREKTHFFIPNQSLPSTARLFVVDFELNTQTKTVNTTEVFKLPKTQTLGDHKVRIYFTHGFDTLNALRVPGSVMTKLLPRVANEHR